MKVLAIVGSPYEGNSLICLLALNWPTEADLGF
jgi:hypothetical protein